MDYKLTPEYVKEFHKDSVKKAQKELGEKNKDIKWKYIYAIQTVAYTGFVAMIKASQEIKPKLSAEERLENWVTSVVGLNLVATVGRKKKFYPIKNVPQVLIEQQKEIIFSEMVEEQRIAGLSPAELAKERKEIIKKLKASQGPGDFLMVLGVNETGLYTNEELLKD